jgi:hypothetical protein
MLKLGETAVLFVRRDKEDPARYFVAVRRSETSRFEERTHDFDIGPLQIPVSEMKDTTDVADIDAAIATLKSILGT